MRGGVILIIALISWTMYVSSKQIARTRRIESEVGALRDEADRIRRENETLGEKIGYFASTDFQEQEAKEKLGLKKANEEVVVIKPSPDVVKMTDTVPDEPQAVSRSTSIPNYEKWWRLFFRDRGG